MSQLCVDCWNTILGRQNPPICGNVIFIFLEQCRTNEHMIVVFVRKFGCWDLDLPIIFMIMWEVLDLLFGFHGSNLQLATIPRVIFCHWVQSNTKMFTQFCGDLQNKNASLIHHNGLCNASIEGNAGWNL